MKQVLVTAAVFILLACSNVEKHIVEEHKNGSAKKIENWDGLILISESSFYENEQLEITGNYKDGLRNGKWESFTEDGKPWSIHNYRLGKKHGEIRVYHDNGQLYYIGQFIDNEKSGLWKFYDKDGELSKEVSH